MDDTAPTLTALDELARDLQELRASAGAPSYAEIARRIGERRAADAAGAHVVRPPKSTIYDAFRYGRRRVNVELAREIVAVLGCDDAEVSVWESRYRDNLIASSIPTLARPQPGLEADTQDDSLLPPVAASLDVEADDSARLRSRLVVVVLVLCVLVNTVAGNLAHQLDLTLFLDMIGTAVAAITLGPWWGALVGVATNLLEWPSPGGSWQSAVFGMVNLTGALVWGYGVRRYGMGRTLPRFLLLNLMVAVACSVVAVPLVMALFGGPNTASGSINHVLDTVGAFTHNVFAAVFSGNLLTSLMDKLLSGFLALTAIELLPRELRAERRGLTLNGTIAHNQTYGASQPESLWHLGAPLNR